MSWCKKHGREFVYSCPECVRDTEFKNFEKLVNPAKTEAQREATCMKIETPDWILSLCPDCKKVVNDVGTLYFNKHTRELKCFNQECSSNGLGKYLTDNK